MEELKRLAFATFFAIKDTIKWLFLIALVIMAIVTWETVFENAPIIAVLFLIYLVAKICANYALDKYDEEDEEEEK